MGVFVENEFTPLAEHVRSARTLLQWSQTDLADRAGVGVSTIADFEKGLRTPIANNLRAIQRALEIAGVQFTPEGATLFSAVSLHLMSAASAADLQFRYKMEAAPLVQQIIGIFGAIQGNSVDLSVVQTATESLKAAMDAFANQHAGAVPQLHRLRKFIGALADDEHFLLLPARPETTAEKLECERFLHRLNNPDAVDDWEESGQALFGLLLKRYNMSSPRTDRPTVIGSTDPAKRKCRFCGRTPTDGATFRKVAHVIPTALGNDYLKSAEECDDCNEYFGRETEPSLIAALDIQRVFLGTQGRGKNDGRPELRFAEGKVFHDGQKVNVQSRAVSKDDASGTFTIDLGRGTTLTPSAVYRALVKILLSVADADQLPHLKKTIEWVRYGMHANYPLPKVAASIINLPPNPSAQITVYRRLDPHPRLPHLVGEFRLGCYVYVYAVPFSKLDSWDLVGFFADPDFRDTFRHYAAVSTWLQQDLSGQTPVTMAPQLRFVRRPS
jgi:transcriptional regulator with XRE-family HTH domain